MKEEIKRTVYLADENYLRARTNDRFRGIPIRPFLLWAAQIKLLAWLMQAYFNKMQSYSGLPITNFQTNFLRDLAVNHIEGITDLPGIKFISIIWTGLR